MPAIKLPSFLTDLFRDLRDRRLLPLVAVLAVGIVAAPLALSKAGSDPDPAGLTASIPPPGGSAESQLEVVSNESGLRDYRRRLGDDPEDPFRQLFTSPLLDGSELGVGGSGPTTEIGGEGSGSPAGPTTPVEPLPPEGTDVPPVEDGDSEPPLPPEEEEEPAYLVTLRAGPPDQMKLQELSEPTILPAEENPLLVFNGLGDKDRDAIFRVTSEVSAVYGEAECLKGTERCERLAVEEGSTISVVYGDDDWVYRLTVVGIERNR